MRLTELEPRFLKIIAEDHWRSDATMDDCDGLMFLCPTCFKNNGGNVGTHSIVRWKPHVPQTQTPKPSRWNILGTSFEDLTLQAGSSSVHLPGSVCGAHFFISNGEISPA